MSDEFATLNREGSVSTITMDDGKANAFSLKMINAFRGCLDEVPDDSGALVIIGRAGVFSGGFDLKTIAAGDAEANRAMSRGGLTLLADLYSFPRPVVMACNGHAIALGAFLLLAADHRIGIDGDFRVCANEVRNDMTIPKVILEIAQDRIVKPHWYRALLHSEPYPIQNAVEPGYLDEVVSQEAFMDTVRARAEDLATLKDPFYRITKALSQAERVERIQQALAEG